MVYANHSFTEEAFLLSSLQEVVRVWARGFGSANFSFQVSDGGAELNLSFPMGRPSDPHVLPVQPPSVPDQHHQDSMPAVLPVLQKKRRRKQKSANRRERDRQRAQDFQAKKQNLEPAVIFPFSGNLLQVKKPEILDQQNLSAAALECDSAPPAVTPPAPSPFPAALPVRKHSTNQGYSDVEVAKKNLFPTNLHTIQPPPPSSRPPDKRSFKVKEADLWTKLFH